jgi:TatD DNase family protein
MIDVHCHFDQVKYPERYITNNENKRIVTIGMTNLPSHFQMGVNHIRQYKFIRLALGLHPLLANQHINEYSNFIKLIDQTSYIGEVGLDFSKEGYATKDIQIKSFEFILKNLKGKNKILSLHSRRAEKEILDMLIEYKVENAIFHWYSGDIKVLNDIVSNKYYFSINSAMIYSENGKKIISQIPRELILTETDNPYIENSNINSIFKYLSNIWKISENEVESTIEENFKRLLSKIKTNC